MSDTVKLSIDGVAVTMPAGTTVSAAILKVGIVSFRRSVTGEPRGPICGMGICFECRVTIDGTPHRRSCQSLCAEGMEVRTNA
jgi:D-hydroxyproline dehydrogenase subunit gamma